MSDLAPETRDSERLVQRWFSVRFRIFFELVTLTVPMEKMGTNKWHPK
jgi:hypothetical protein